MLSFLKPKVTIYGGAGGGASLRAGGRSPTYTCTHWSGLAVNLMETTLIMCFLDSLTLNMIIIYKMNILLCWRRLESVTVSPNLQRRRFQFRSDVVSHDNSPLRLCLPEGQNLMSCAGLWSETCPRVVADMRQSLSACRRQRPTSLVCCGSVSDLCVISHMSGSLSAVMGGGPAATRLRRSAALALSR